MPAPNIRHPCAALQLLLNAIESRYPLRYQMSPITWPKKALGPAKQVRMMLVPANATARTERFFDLWDGLHARVNRLESARQEHGAIFDRKGERLFRFERESI